MTPSTVHLLASLIRMDRGIANAYEKWVRSQPKCHLTDELLKVIEVQRKVLADLEKQLSSVGVDLETSV